MMSHDWSVLALGVAVGLAIGVPVGAALLVVWMTRVWSK